MDYAIESSLWEFEKIEFIASSRVFANFAKRLNFTLYNDVPFRLRTDQKNHRQTLFSWFECCYSVLWWSDKNTQNSNCCMQSPNRFIATTTDVKKTNSMFSHETPTRKKSTAMRSNILADSLYILSLARTMSSVFECFDKISLAPHPSVAISHSRLHDAIE